MINWYQSLFSSGIELQMADLGRIHGRIRFLSALLFFFLFFPSKFFFLLPSIPSFLLF
uniref:Uncharacterized protein n=1 Tax=Manihot esculenta TaxID=3983 RepID=A0A2C9WHE3_MANES